MVRGSWFVPPPTREAVVRGLDSIPQFCTDRGYRSEGEAVPGGAWPVQFIPGFSPLTKEAMDEAETADFEGDPFRVVRAEYLAVIALSVGRAKDLSPTPSWPPPFQGEKPSRQLCLN
ncbi:MAG: hypothetical protein V1750_09300 [Acidobacteriota bacterium]